MNGLITTHLFGIPVFVSDYAVGTTERPNRIHKYKEWMSGRVYHKRVQKKWIKRFGYAEEACMFKTPQGIIVHPSLIHKLKDATHDIDINQGEQL